MPRVNPPHLFEIQEFLLVGQDVVFDWVIINKTSWSFMMSFHCVYGDLKYYLKEAPLALMTLRQQTEILTRMQQTRSADSNVKIYHEIPIGHANGHSYVDVVNLIMCLLNKFDLSVLPNRINRENVNQFPLTYLRDAQFFSDLLSANSNLFPE
jgi:hypothetical protein